MMLTKTPVKKNLSSIQVLKTFKILLQGDYTMQEILEKLNKDNDDYIYTNSVVSKYIHTFRVCGINIPKINNKYVIASMPFGFELSNNFVKLLENMQEIARNDMTSKCNRIFDQFIKKINRFSNQNVLKLDKKTFHFIFELFERAIKEKRKIKLICRNRNELESCIPIKIEENNGKTFLHIIYQNQDKMIDSDRIAAVEVLNEKFIKNFNEQVVIYELKGDLAIRYKLRDNENLLKPYDGKSMTVSNHGENKEILFSRLLRYDDKCEIINPKIYREEMMNIINSALKNYGL